MKKLIGCGGLLLALATGPVFAAEAPKAGPRNTVPASAFKPGDKVKAKFGREWRPATVLKILPNGWITVSMEVTRQTLTPTLMPDQVIAPDAPEPREPGKEYIDGPDMRDWTLADGTKLPRARVHHYNPKMKKVLLQKENGVCYHAELAKLSAADRDYISKLGSVKTD